MRKALLVSLLASLAVPALAQVQPTEPQPLPVNDRIPAARDVAYPGTMGVHVDATDTARGIFRVQQTIPVAGPGPMTLLYPEWLPGKHAPRGPIAALAGLRISANGQPVQWRRDARDVYAFHVDVPVGASQLDVEFQYLSPIEPNQGRIVVTPDMMNIQWETVSLYPAGYFIRNIAVQPSVTLPAGWTGATSLDVAEKQGNRIVYQPVSYEVFIDSPMFAGRHYREFDLGHDVDLNVVADRPADLAATDEQIAIHRELVDQALKLFGARHYDEYEFLLALTDELGGIGLEHLRSSENSHDRDYFTDWKNGSPGRDLLAHEFVHSWNGKYRRPAGMWTPEYSTPTVNDLLWLYEGQTQFWGLILSARSGLMPTEDVMAELARTAAYYDDLPGRSWRPLVDTTYDPIVKARRPQPFSTWQRSEDYYREGMLIWLDVDSKLRELTGGKRSMNDFARAFFGVNPGDTGTLTYTFADVAETLNRIAPYDWATYLDQRVERTGEAPLDWIERAGYRLVYTDTPTDYFKAREQAYGFVDLSHTLGITLGKDGSIGSIAWDSPLFNQGVTGAATIVAVNGREFAGEDFKEAITAAKGGNQPIRLLIKEGDRYRTIDLAYHDGLRYPRLEKVGAGRSGLDALLKPLP